MRRRSFATRTASILATSFLGIVSLFVWLAWTSYGNGSTTSLAILTKNAWLTSLTMLSTNPLEPPTKPPINNMAFAFSQLSLAEANIHTTTHKPIATPSFTTIVTPKMRVASPKRLAIGWTLDTGTKNLEAVIQASQGLNVLAPKWLHVDGPNGALANNIEKAVVTYAHQHNVHVWAVVDNGFNANLTHSFLRYKDTQDRLIARLVTIVKQDNLDGINVDFEGISSQDRWNFSRFIEVLSQALHAIHRTVSVDLPPDIVFAQNDGPYNHKALASAADNIILMGYDEHWGGDAIAGPTASLPWVKQAVADMLKTGVPAQKLILGIPFYTQDWTVNQHGTVLSSNALSLVQTNQLLKAHNLAANWNRQLGVHFVRFKENGTTHEIWLEDNRSLLLTLQLVAQNHLGGAAAWYLGLEEPSTWSSLVMAVHAVFA